MTLSLVLSPTAEADLQEATDFYELQKPGLGEVFLRALDEGFERIRTHPNAFRIGEDGVRTGFLRRFPYGVRFRVVSNRIEVLAVWHERRHPDGWKTRIGAAPHSR